MHTHEYGRVTHLGLVPYDAYGGMSARESTSIALPHARQSGVVLSSISRQDQARLYARQVHDGQPELELSPEEDEAVRIALRGATGQAKA